MYFNMLMFLFPLDASISLIFPAVGTVGKGICMFSFLIYFQKNGCDNPHFYEQYIKIYSSYITPINRDTILFSV